MAKAKTKSTSSKKVTIPAQVEESFLSNTEIKSVFISKEPDSEGKTVWFFKRVQAVKHFSESGFTEVPNPFFDSVKIE